MKKSRIIIYFTLGIIFAAILAAVYSPKTSQDITSFEECIEAGYPVMESFPRQCNTPEGKNFVEEIEYTEPNLTKMEDYYNSIDYSCQTDSDCEIKNIANCCGYYPACTNKDAVTSPETVSQICGEEDLIGVCGFPSIDDCGCVKNTCKPKFQGEYINN